MTTIGDLATRHPIQVLTTTRVEDAARFMAELGVGDVIVTDPDSGIVVGMLTDRDVVVRLVARRLDAPTTEVGQICTMPATTIPAGASLDAAMDLMRNEALRRLPVVDNTGRPVGIVSIEDLAASDAIDDSDLRSILQCHAAAYRRNRVSPEVHHTLRA